MYSTSYRRPRQGFAYHPDYGGIRVMQRRPPVNVIRHEYANDSWKFKLAGFCNIFNEKLSVWERIVWFLVCFAALAVCVYQISDRIGYYMEEPVITKSYFMTNKTINFPAVTVCPDSLVHSIFELGNKLGVNPTEFDELLKNGTVTVYDIWNYSRKESLNKFLVTFRQGAVNVKQVFHISETETPLGGCITLSPKQEFDFQVSPISVQVELNPSDMFKIMLHNPGTLMTAQYHMLHNGRALTRPCAYEDIVQVTKIIKYNTKREPCADEILVNKCLALCIERKVKSFTSHGCSLPFMYANEEKPCYSIQSIKDVVNGAFEITSKIHLPDCVCPKVCNEVMYKVANERKSQCGYPHVLFVVLTIFENVIPVIQDERGYTWLFLCCDIGGTIGLWLGICLIEVLEEIINILSKLLFWISIKRRKKSFTTETRNAEIRIVREQPKECSCNDLGIPGFEQFVNCKLPMRARILWLVVSIVFLCFSTYQLLLLIERYIDDPSLTTTYYEDNTTGAYPLLTLCPDTNEDFFPVINPYLYNFAFKGLATPKSVLNKLADGNITVDNLWNLSRFNIEEIKYDLTGVNQFDIGNHTAKFIEVTTALGTCISIVPENYFIPKLRGSVMKTVLTGRNTEISYMRVILHDAADSILLPYLRTGNDYKFSIALGIPKIKFAFSKIIRRNTYKNPCSSRLNVAKCQLRCTERKIFSKVTKPCRLPFMQNSVEFPLCLNYKDFMSVNNSTLTTLLDFKFEDCNCPVKCKEIILKVENYYAESWRMIGAELTFSQDRHVVIEDVKAYSFFALISDIGSTMGMLFGFCAFQVLEILLNLALRFVIMQKRYFSQKKSPILSQQRESLESLQGRTIVLQCNANHPKEENSEINIPGLKRILNKTSSKYVRSVWLVICVTAVCMCFFQCAERITYFLTDPSDIITYYQYNSSLSYPILTIGKCREMFTEGDLQGPKVNEAFPDLWSTGSRIAHIFINGISSNLHVFSKETNTTMGGALSIIIDKPILYHSILSHFTTSVDFMEFSEDGFDDYWVTAQTPAEDALLVPYDVPHRPSRKIDSFIIDVFSMRLISIKLRVVEINYRNTWQNPCSNGETVSRCLVDCLEKRIYLRAKTFCRIPFMQSSQVIPECVTNEEMFRILVATLLELKSIDFESPESCSCPRKCKTLWYLINKIEHQPRRRGGGIWVDISVYIPENQIFITREEVAYPFLKLLSDIGGTIGFYIGFGSLQMFELQFRLFKICFHRAIKKLK